MRAAASESPRQRIDPARWDRLKNILGEALEQNASSARVAVIERECAGDAVLLREAESLLTAAEILRDDSTDWLEHAAEKATGTLWDDDEDHSRNGQRIGAYVVVRQLGRGGMGAVYLAARADGEFEKQVAIKVLKRGTDTDEILRRFRIERQIVATLDHPNIARLLDAGTTDDGLPYFVMEYVAGVPVTRFVAEQKLPIAARLRLFLKIGAAVEIAHKAGVVHRDLKPSNILITADGEPKLLDFGIAKLLATNGGAEEQTQPGGEHLTPHSASPEQVRGESVTAASDVYALGAMLYQMLTKRTPHQFAVSHPSRQEVMRVVCEEEIVAPSRVVEDAQLHRQLRGDLDNILLRALHKEPSLRYPTVAEFAEDIGRHLEGGVVQARPTTVAYRLQRFIARNRLLAPRSIATALVLLALGGGIAAVVLSSRPSRVAAPPPVNRAAAEAAPEKSIAVLPFENLSAEPENAYFAAGVQDAILTDLAKIAELKVINRTSVRHYGSDAPRDLAEISRDLHVAYVLEGSVQRAGNRVRVTAKLTDTRTSAQAWAERYEQDLANVFAVQDEIARSVANRLRVAISPEERSAAQTRTTTDVQAYELYLRAKQSEQSAERTASNLEEQVALLEQSIARDPNFLPALCALARVHVLAYFFNFDHTPARLERAKAAVDAAARVAPDAGDVHLARGILLYWGNRDFPAALAELVQARRRLPNDAEVLFFTALIERRQGRFEQSTKNMEAAASLDPRNGSIGYDLALSYTGLSRYDDAARLLDRLVAAKPDSFVFAQARAMIDFAERADLRQWRDVVTGPLSKNASGEQLDSARMELALMERNYDAAAEALTRLPDSRFGGFFTPRQWYAGLIALGRGDVAQAEGYFTAARAEVARRIETQTEESMTWITLAEIDARLGRTDDARRAGEEAARLTSAAGDATELPEIRGRLAAVYARIGDHDRAIDLAAQVAHEPFGLSYGFLALDEAWDPVREDPRFISLLALLAQREITR